MNRQLVYWDRTYGFENLHLTASIEGSLFEQGEDKEQNMWTVYICMHD